MSQDATPGSGTPHEPVLHDFTYPGWGHHIEFLNRDQTTCEWKTAGHSSPKPKVGDLVRVRSQRPGVYLLYRVESVRHARDPQDMFFATLAFDREEQS